MSSSTEPSAQNSLPQSNGSPPSGSPLPGHLTTGRGARPKALPSAVAGGKLLPLAIAGAVLMVGAAVAGWYFFLRTPPARADVLLHTVKLERLTVTVSEKGTLESAENRDIVCKVRAGSKGYASTINRVIADGDRVKPGQLLMVLDDSALKEQEDNQQIAFQTALANKVKAEKDYDIAVTQNEQSIATAEVALTAATNDLNNYTGVTYDSTRAPLVAVAGGPFGLVEAGTFRQSVDDQLGKVRLGEAEVQQNAERSAWAERMVKLNYMSAAQAQSDKSKLDSSVENLRSQKAKLNQLLNSERDQTLTKLVNARIIAQIGLRKATQEAESNLVKFEAEKKKCYLIYAQEDDKLRDLVTQRALCKIVAPNNIEPDSMVVYYKAESSNRFSGNTQGVIEQGAQVKEGQKMLRIPNLRKMQVNTKVHEAMVARIRGDIRVPTHVTDITQKIRLLNTDPFARVVSQRPERVDDDREKLYELEYRKVADGQKATIRVDAVSEKVFEGHVRVKAAVASQADSWVSDVKLYQTLVMIDHEVLPDGTKKPIGYEVLPDGTTRTIEELTPDMTAEVTITVDTAKEPVLTVPIQAVIGGAEMGTKREVFVKTATGFDRREIKLGMFNEKMVEVRDGLAEGDQVVINPKVLLATDDKTKTREDGNKGKGGSKGEGDAPKGEGMPKGGEGAPKGEGGNKGGGGNWKGGGGGKGGGGKGGGIPGGGPPAGT